LDRPLLLAVEAATAAASVALVQRGTVLAERRTDPQRDLSETLLPAIQALLAKAGFLLPQIEAFAVSIGPGSFTSLRVGLSTVKGLAFGSALPAIAVPTLAALAYAGEAEAGRAEQGRMLIPVLDAGRGEFYAAGYTQPEAWASQPASAWKALPQLPESVYNSSDLLEKSPQAATFVGEAGLLATLSESLEPGAGLESRACPVQAGFVGKLAEKMLDAGLSEPVEGLSPRYVRRAEAEARLTGQRLEAGHGS
jgi:tRNA threonylcarbamoyladenosine biosynthesis protein TsaB